MSNSFDVNDILSSDVPGTPLIRLLQAMAGEWARIAEDLNRLGATISPRAMEGSDLASAVELQAFDTVQQRAQGQANLLARLARKIADDHIFDRKRLNELLEDIPFHSVRAGLEAAYDGDAPADAGETSDEVDWF